MHNGLKGMIESVLPEDSGYTVKLEKLITSCNSSGTKRCDIVLYKADIPFIVFPVKHIMTNYYQNKNNGWENMTGECCQLKWCNPNLHIIPINIIFNQVPYLLSGGLIKHYEGITHDKSYSIYDKLTDHNITTDMINYIVDVEPISDIGSRYDTCPTVIGFNVDTPFRAFQEIIRPLIQ